MPASNLQLFAVCVLIWGSTWFAITYQLGSVAPELSVGYRFLLASAALFAFCRWRGHPLGYSARQHADLALFGACMFCLSYILVYHAEIHIVSAMVAVGYSTMPMINMLAARCFFGTPMTSRVGSAALLGIFGIVCIYWTEFGKFSASRDAELGALLTILSVLASSAGNMTAIRIQRRGFGTWPSMAWGMLYGGIMALVYALLAGRPLVIDLRLPYVISMVYLALFGSIVTFGCYLTLIERIGAARSSYVGVMVPVVALGVSFLFEHLAWTTATTAGVCLLLIGNVLMLSEPAR